MACVADANWKSMYSDAASMQSRIEGLEAMEMKVRQKRQERQQMSRDLAQCQHEITTLQEQVRVLSATKTSNDIISTTQVAYESDMNYWIRWLSNLDGEMDFFNLLCVLRLVVEDTKSVRNSRSHLQ